MHACSLGVYLLNDDGTTINDPTTGEPLLSYTNDDIFSLAAAWTGFEKQPTRANQVPQLAWSRGGSG